MYLNIFAKPIFTFNRSNDDNNLGVLVKIGDKYLKKGKDPIILTLDKNIQFIIRQELIQSSEIFKNVGSAALLMDINSGKIFH